MTGAKLFHIWVLICLGFAIAWLIEAHVLAAPVSPAYLAEKMFIAAITLFVVWMNL